MQEAIWEEVHCKRFYLEEQARICQGRLCDDFVYTAISPTTREVLNGTYNYLVDFDESTGELCDDCIAVCSGIPKGSTKQMRTLLHLNLAYILAITSLGYNQS